MIEISQGAEKRSGGAALTASRLAKRAKEIFAQSAPAQKFTALYADNINPEDLKEDRIELYAHAIGRLWDLAQKRKGKGTALSIDWPSPKTEWLGDYILVSILNDDKPFLVDSATMALHAMGLVVESVVHPTVWVSRGKEGKLSSLQQNPAPSGQGKMESYIQFLVSGPHGLPDKKQLQEKILSAMNDVRVAVEDWQAMRRKLREVMAAIPSDGGAQDPAEAAQFLDWLDQHHFIFLGYRAYDFPKAAGKKIGVAKGSGLGILGDDTKRLLGGVRDLDPQSPAVKAVIADRNWVSIRKSPEISTIHRAVQLDVIVVKRLNSKGEITGEHCFAGLFTSLAYNRNPFDIPLLRQKAQSIVDASHWRKGGHKAKILIDVLTSYPRDELIQISKDELLQAALNITRIHEKRRTALFVRRDLFGGYYSCLIFTPRELFSSELRQAFGDILCGHLKGQIRQFYTQVTDSHLARVHFLIDVPQGAQDNFDATAIEKELALAARGFSEKLQEGLLQNYAPSLARTLLRRYEGAFTPSYQKTYTLNDTLIDIRHVESVLDGTSAAKGLAIHFYARGASQEGYCGLAVYRKNQELALSDLVPMLENFGFRIIDEIPTLIAPLMEKERAAVYSYDLLLQRRDKKPVDIMAQKSALTAALAETLSGRNDSDGFNRLCVALSLDVRDVSMLRVYAQYLRQTGFLAAQQTIEETLAKQSAIGKLLRDFFYARFDPGFLPARAEACQELVDKIEQELGHVSNLDEDRILRRYLNAIQATLRTNFFQSLPGGGDKEYISIKIASGQIEEMPEPKPWAEIFVSSPRMRAVHLRGGKVARGGIRHSDRADDFRTEVLGLVKAQMVKNTVIVPVGSKGGFVVTAQRGDDAKAYQQEVVECYKTMIRGMLDITDNLRQGKIVPPAGVIRYDGDDPYLVVAADKGTAKFSDIANGVSAEYGFWLGDAFASGGSAGYDHKAMAITSRGAWVAVKRHFREMGFDIESKEFRATGVGDMAGDVFGNGMLQSDNMKLVAAFNHSHIFIDPDPDSKRSFQERKRLFENPHLTWADYDAKSLSKGGGVYSRQQKKITLGAEAQAALGTQQKDFTPAQLIQTILQAPVELLWLGGIGTFIKSSEETHADAGDRVNDALRINARQLRCKIVGEGANLGFTQKARIEYAKNGGRINTDAIDNSAGVDTSDHEVNIKILLGEIEQSGKLKRPARDILLKSMTDEVADLVLQDNAGQTMALSMMEAASNENLALYQALTRFLEKTVKLNPAIEFLPDEDEWNDRAAQRMGLMRPELAVLLSYSKMSVYSALLASKVPDDAYFATELMRYFPEALQKKYAKQIEKHPLRREIVATCLTNMMINRMGSAFAYKLSDVTGFDLPAVVRAYMLVRATFGIEGLWQDISRLNGKISVSTQIQMFLAVNRFIERATIWFLRQRKSRSGILQVLKTYRPAVEKIQEQMQTILPAEDLDILEGKVKSYVAMDVPAKLARRVVYARMLGGLGDVVNIASDLSESPVGTAKLYFSIGHRFGLDWMRRSLSKLASASPWQSRAISSLLDDLLILQARLCKDAAKNYGCGEKSLASWLADNPLPVANFDALLTELRSGNAVDVSMITVAISKLRGLLA